MTGIPAFADMMDIVHHVYGAGMFLGMAMAISVRNTINSKLNLPQRLPFRADSA